MVRQRRITSADDQKEVNSGLLKNGSFEEMGGNAIYNYNFQFIMLCINVYWDCVTNLRLADLKNETMRITKIAVKIMK